MKKLTTKLASFILTLSMLFSLTVPAFAAENYDSIGTISNTQESIDAAREAYAALTPEAKVIFEESLAYDAEMLKFHTTYVDQNFTLPAVRPETKSATAVADPMRVLMAELSGLGLPSAVLYSLKAMGAGMAAAVADGPLPVGDILLAAATVSVAVTIAANWKTVSSKWNSIVSAFQKAFEKSTSNVVSAFQKLRENVQTEYKAKFNKSAQDAVGNCNSNKQHHIIGQSKHNWNKLFPKGPKWSGVAPILIKVLQDGKETAEGGGTYLRTLVYQGQTVVVRFVKDTEGFVKYISTAWVK